MPKVSVMAKIVTKPGKSEELVAAFGELFSQVDSEEGTEVYCLNRSGSERDTLWFNELYADEAAFAAHGASEAMSDAGSALGPLVESFEMIIGTPVRAKGGS